MAHTTKVTKMKTKDLKEYLDGRSASFEERWAHDPDVASTKTQDDEELYGDGGWDAKCSCGWTGNNPHPSEESALDALAYHLDSVGGEED